MERYVFQFLCYGREGVGFTKPSGRPGRLARNQQHGLAELIDARLHPVAFSIACWRSPMVQQLTQDRFGVVYNVLYHAQHNLGFSFQEAAFVPNHPGEIAVSWRNQESHLHYFHDFRSADGEGRAALIKYEQAPQ